MLTRFHTAMFVAMLLAGSVAHAELVPVTDEALSSTVAGGGLSLAVTTQVAGNATTGAAFSIADTDGGAPNFASFATAADINFRKFGMNQALFNITVDASDRQQISDASSAPLLGIGVMFPSTLTFFFNTAWPAPAGLGAGVIDLCTHTTTPGACAPGSAGDYPVLMAPASGVNFALTSTNLQVAILLGGAAGLHEVTITDTAPATLTISGPATSSNLALVDPGNVPTPGTTVGGIGFNQLTLSGLEFGTSAATATTIDNCDPNSSATICQPALTNGKSGVLLNIGSGAMTNVNIVAKGLTIGNVGSGANANGSNSLGLVALTNLDLSNTSVMVYAH